MRRNYYQKTSPKRQIILWILLILTLSLVLGACREPQKNETGSQPNTLKVSASFSILGDWVKEVGGDRLSVFTLVGPDGDTHAYEPSPRDSINLASSVLVFEIGLEFETWMDGLYESSGSKAQRIEVSDGMQLIHLTDEDLEEEAEEHHEHSGEFDPHVWQSVQNARQAVSNIVRALSQADPEGTSYYEDRGKIYSEKLLALDKEIKDQLGLVPENRRLLVSNHETLAYFARDYQFIIPANAFGSVSTEGAEPSAGQLSTLIETLKAYQVPAVFAETMVSSRGLELAAQEAGVKLAPPLYTDSLSSGSGPAADYISLMRYNAKIIAQSLAGD